MLLGGEEAVSNMLTLATSQLIAMRRKGNQIKKTNNKKLNCKKGHSSSRSNRSNSSKR